MEVSIVGFGHQNLLKIKTLFIFFRERKESSSPWSNSNHKPAEEESRYES